MVKHCSQLTQVKMFCWWEWELLLTFRFINLHFKSLFFLIHRRFQIPLNYYFFLILARREECLLSSVLWTFFIKLALLRLNLRYYIKHDVSCMFSETYRNYFFNICYNWVCGRKGESALPDLMFGFRQIAFSQAFIPFFSSSGWTLIDIGNSWLV